MSLVSSFCISEVEGVSSLSLMPQIQQIMAWWLQQSCCHSGASMVPTFCYHGTQLSKHRPHTCTPCQISWARGVWRLGQARISGSNGTVTAPTGVQCITNVAESGFGIKPGAVGIHFSHNLAINEPRLTLIPRADIVSVVDKSLSYATARLVDHSMHCEHRMEFLPTPLQQTGQGYLPVFCRTSWSSPETRNLVFFMMRQSTLLSIPAFNALSLEIHSSWVSAMKTRSSVKRSSHGAPVWNSRNIASSTRMKSSGLRTEPWCTPTPTLNSSLYWPLTHTWLWALEYIAWMTCTAHSLTPRLLEAHHRTFLGIRSQAYSTNNKILL